MTDSAAPLVCDCDPYIFKDGSKGHYENCAAYPWCPHEVVAASCLMPCNCSCAPCVRLKEAIR